MSRTISGFPILFDVNSLPIAGEFVESIASRALTRDPAKLKKIVALRGHDPMMPLANGRNDTLRLRVSATGLWAFVGLPQTTYADDLLAMREHGVGLGWSFAFRASADEWQMLGDLPHRTVTAMEVSEVSAGVQFAAYPQTEMAGAGPRVDALDVRDGTREAALYVARLMRQVGLRHRSIRLGCRYRDGHVDEIRLLDEPRPGWRLRLARARQRLAEVS